MNNPHKPLILEIKHLMVDAEMENKAVAAAIGVHPNTWCNAITGHRTSESAKGVLLAGKSYLLNLVNNNTDGKQWATEK